MKADICHDSDGKAVLVLRPESASELTLMRQFAIQFGIDVEKGLLWSHTEGRIAAKEPTP